MRDASYVGVEGVLDVRGLGVPAGHLEEEHPLRLAHRIHCAGFPSPAAGSDSGVRVLGSPPLSVSLAISRFDLGRDGAVVVGGWAVGTWRTSCSGGARVGEQQGRRRTLACGPRTCGTHMSEEGEHDLRKGSMIEGKSPFLPLQLLY